MMDGSPSRGAPNTGGMRGRRGGADQHGRAVARQGADPDAIRLAMNSLMERGHRIVYVDTAYYNLASQRAIAKCGFGDPVAVHITGRAT